jgi:hypothetical protein
MGTTVEQWSVALLNKLSDEVGHLVPDHDNNLDALQIWAQWEKGGIANDAKNNVLNTTEDGFGKFLTEPDGLPAYPTIEDGIAATAATLVQPQYSEIVKCLSDFAPTRDTLTAIQNSPWAASHYFYQLLNTNLEADFAQVEVSEDTLPEPAPKPPAPAPAPEPAPVPAPAPVPVPPGPGPVPAPAPKPSPGAAGSHTVVAIIGELFNRGYWLVTADGTIHSIGNLPKFEVAPNEAVPTEPIVAACTTPNQDGVWLTDAAGHVFSRGLAINYGNLPE